MPAVPPSTLDDLGVPGCLTLAALLMAQERRTAIAPTHRMALAQLAQLRDHGIIDTPWPELRWAVATGAEETPLEQIQWRYTWLNYVRSGLLDALQEFLETAPRDEQGLELRLRVWTELLAGEAESFLAAQLKKSRFDVAWAADIGFAIRELRLTMPIGQWRYCAWAAVRHGASVAQQQAVADPASIREAIFSELRRRAAWVAQSGGGERFCFVPFHARADNALSRLFAENVSRIGVGFWTSSPSLEALLTRPLEPHR